MPNTKDSFYRIFYAAILTWILLFTSGCGRNALKTEPVSGVLTLDGKPLVGANVMFHPKDMDGFVAVGLTNEEGIYRLTAMKGGKFGKGTVTGEYHVTFSKTDIVLTNPDEIPDNHVYRTDFLLPLVYADINTSPFSATVVRGKNIFDFDLKSRP